MTMQNQINFTFFVHHHFQLNHHPNLISNFNFPFCERTNLHLNGIGFVVLYHAGFYPIPFDFIGAHWSFSKSNGLSPLKTTGVRLSSLKSKVQIAMKPRHHVYSKNLSNLQTLKFRVCVPVPDLSAPDTPVQLGGKARRCILSLMMRMAATQYRLMIRCRLEILVAIISRNHTAASA